MARAAAFLSLVLAAAAAAGAGISGVASVTDGDTLRIGPARIRLHGIDAPESKQTCRAGGETWACGAAATRALRSRIAGRRSSVPSANRDRYGRIVAVCRVDGADVNAWMVAQGWAVAYRKYSADYVSHEAVLAAAKAARRGLWRGEFVAPSRWRRGERLEAAAASGAGDYRINGNISRNGTRIYHVPGGQSYAKTRIDTAKGERVRGVSLSVGASRHWSAATGAVIYGAAACNAGPPRLASVSCRRIARSESLFCRALGTHAAGGPAAAC